MRKLALAVVLIATQWFVGAQVKTPQPSPKSVIQQVVGLTDVEIEYSRPSAKGRVVFGDLVPYGKLWRTGANQNTMISFSDDVIVQGIALKKGKYALFTTPKVDLWEVVFYTDTDNWGTPDTWDDTKVAAKMTVKPEMLNRKVESFTVGINALESDSAVLELSWEKTWVGIKFEVPTQKTAMASIEKVMAGPSDRDYFSSAQYFLNNNGDLNKALEYINKALAMTKPGADVPFWYLRLKSLIQAKLGDKKGAIESAKLSLAAAAKAKNDDYVKMNTDSIKEWSK
ncbi:MAG: dihydrolipoamide dehydrogenase [Flavobacterium sp. BFFFF2]|nr:MAG: dihydrolipoamide dehydrogenase [Flavobacterium sp. BFFFF2]